MNQILVLQNLYSLFLPTDLSHRKQLRRASCFNIFSNFRPPSLPCGWQSIFKLSNFQIFKSPPAFAALWWPKHFHICTLRHLPFIFKLSNFQITVHLSCPSAAKAFPHLHITTFAFHFQIIKFSLSSPHTK